MSSEARARVAQPPPPPAYGLLLRATRLVLGEDRNRIFLLGGLYLVFGSLLELVVHYGQTNDVQSKWKLLLTLPVAALDSYAYWWSFISLYQVTAALKAKYVCCS